MKEMKILDNAFDTIVSFEMLETAYRRARKRKRYRAEVLDFSNDLDANLHDIQAALLSETFVFGPYRRHWVYVPKRRMVMALPFPSRIVQWSIYLILQPFYEGFMIEDSFACRNDKGSLAAALRLQYWLKEAEGKRDKWVIIKIDISKYFYRVDHDVLFEILSTRIKDERLLRLLRNIIECNGAKFGLPRFTSPEEIDEIDWLTDVGMPIGNLTSQLFANIYLNELDLFCKHVLKIHRYVRYMDDIIIVAPSRDQALQWREAIGDFLERRLHLDMNRKTAISSPRRVEFVGFIVTPRKLYLRKQTARRIKRAFRGICRKYFQGKFSRADLDRRIASYEGMLEHVEADNLRKRLNEIYISERDNHLTNLHLCDLLCNIISDMARIIQAQRHILEQYNALVLEKEIEDIRQRCTIAIGSDIWPDGSDPGQEA